jgi:hypothetical protein
VPRRGDDSPGSREHGVDIHAPERPPDSVGDCEFEARDRPAWAYHARQLTQGCARVVHVAEQVRHGKAVERVVVKGQVLGARLDQLHLRREVLARNREHLRALVDAYHGATLLPE